jgi:Uma2 family endonuclease
MATVPNRQKMTVEEYLHLDGSNPDQKYEYYDGEVRLMAGGTKEHSAIAANLQIEVGAALRGTDCRTFTSDARVQISAARYVYPDMTVSCDREDWGGGDTLHTPTVVFEVLSPSNEHLDRTKKQSFYRACPSIQEIVLVSTTEPLIELFRRDPAIAPFWPHAAFALGDTLTLASIGVSIVVDEIYRDITFPPAPPDPPEGPTPSN